MSEYFLNLDMYDYQTRLEFEVKTGGLNYKDCIKLFVEKQITRDEFELCKEWLLERNENDINERTKNNDSKGTHDVVQIS